ncbi:MAG: NAD(P)/FAD-dependent oxidoreductase [Bacillus sp. (in: Bacteria)]|nr:NAD(P)/FAD-dependent oxidoreductase [Bacillus sp. (in: firmicutes)]
MEKVDVVIVGGGPAGISATIWCQRLGINHLLLEAKQEVGGQLEGIHNKIIDYPGIIAENGKEMQHLFTEHLQLLKCNFRTGTTVIEIDPLDKVISYSEKEKQRKIQYNFLIYAAGSKQRCLNVPGESEMIERGEVYSATRDKRLFSGKKVAVIGGGDRAFGGALLLAEEGAVVTLIHRSSYFRARKTYQDAVFNHQAINVHANTEVKRLLGNSHVEQVEVIKNGVKQYLNTDAVFIRIGVAPQTELIQDFVTLDDQGYTVVDKVGQTDTPSIFAIGDTCNTPDYSGITSSAGQGMIAVKCISEQLKLKHGTPYF